MSLLTESHSEAGLSGSRNLVAALQGLESFATAVLGACVCVCVISSTLRSGCSSSGTGCYNHHSVWLVPRLQSCRQNDDDAVMYYPEGLYMAQRHFALFSHSNAPDLDEVMQVCVDASNSLDPDSPAGYKCEAERQAGWAYIPLCCCKSVYKGDQGLRAFLLDVL